MQGPGYPAGSQPPDPNVPQPPDAQTQALYAQAQNVPQGGGPTLGQANGDPSGLPPGNPMLDQYTQAIGATLDMMKQRGFIRDTVPPQPGPGILESLGTFGIANLKHIADENTRREENYRILQQNREIGLKGVDLATKMVDTQAMGGLANQRIAIALQNNQIALARFLSDQQARQTKDARNQVNDHILHTMRPAPKNANEMRLMRLDGWGPSADNPGYWEQQGGGGGGGMGGTQLKKVGNTWVDPNTPAGQALAATGGDTGGGAASNAPLPGELPEDTATRLQARAKGVEKTTTEDAAAAAETMRNMKLVESWLKDPMFDRAVSDLPNQGMAGIAESAAGPAVAYLKRRTGSPGAAYLGTANTNVMPALRAMEAGAKNMRIAGQVLGDFGVKKQMTQLQNYRMSQPEAQQFKKTLLDRFKQIRTQLGTGDQSDSGATTDTATSGGGPPSTVGGATQPTPFTGLTPGSLDSLLKKHGY